MARIMRWCVPDDALRVRWLGTTSERFIRYILANVITKAQAERMHPWPL